MHDTIDGGTRRCAAASHPTRWVGTDVADADAFFPRFDAREWIEITREERASDARHAFAMSFVDYQLRGDEG
jgi:dihydrofolate reductase